MLNEMHPKMLARISSILDVARKPQKIYDHLTRFELDDEDLMELAVTIKKHKEVTRHGTKSR